MSSRILPYYEQLEKVKSSERPEVWDETMEPPCDIVTTFHGTLFNTARNKFLLDPCGGEKEDGCKAIDLMACSDLSTLFFSWRTFWNCLTLAGVAMELYDDSESPLDETTSRIQVGRGGQHQLEFNTSWLDGFNLMQIFNLTFECAQASCEQWSLDGNCSIAYPDFSTTNVSLREEMVGTLKNVCDDLPTLNLDIAGPGVSAFRYPFYSSATILTSSVASECRLTIDSRVSGYHIVHYTSHVCCGGSHRFSPPGYGVYDQLLHGPVGGHQEDADRCRRPA